MALRSPSVALCALAAGDYTVAKVAVFALSALSWVINAPFAEAQTGGFLVPAKPRAMLQSPGTNRALTVHRNALGKPCLDYDAISRAHIASPDIYDNVVSVNNQCAQRITVTVCYFNSDSCVDVELPPFQRKDVVIGVRPQSQFFRYSYKEKQ